MRDRIDRTAAGDRELRPRQVLAARGASIEPRVHVVDEDGALALVLHATWGQHHDRRRREVYAAEHTRPTGLRGAGRRPGRGRVRWGRRAVVPTAGGEYDGR